MAFFSVAIPAYKGKYLSAAINSVLSQTVTDFELIIVNDASPDNITEIVQSFNDNRIRYYINETNIGGLDPVANWNKCLSYATGTFFSLLCDDDRYEPTFLESLYELSLRYEKCNVFKAGVAVIDKEERIVSTYPSSPEWENCSDYIHNVSLRKRKQTISEWMYRRDYIVKCGGYEAVPMAWGADYLSVMKFALDGGIASEAKVLTVFRKSGENISTTYEKNLELKVLGTKVYADKLRKLVTDNNIVTPSIIQDIEVIRTFEQKAVMRMVSPLVLLKKKVKLIENGVSPKTLVDSIIRNFVKKIV